MSAHATPTPLNEAATLAEPENSDAASLEAADHPPAAAPRPPVEQLVVEAVGAERDGDPERALRLWAEMREVYPDNPRGFVSGGVALKRRGRLAEAIALLAEGVARFPADEWLANEYAWALYDQGGPEAASVWEDLRRRFPNNPESYVGSGLVLRQRGELDAADALYREALGRFDGHRGLLTDFAWVAELRGDTGEALARWQTVRARFPDHRQAAARCGVLLLNAGRFDEADALLGDTLARCPPNEELLTAHAWAAHHRRDWPQALKRWEAVLIRYPDRRDPRRMAAQTLIELRRYPEASAVLAPALRLDPDDLELRIVQGWLTLRRGDAAVAEALWRGIRTRAPERPDAHLGLALSLREQRRLEDAERVLAEALKLFPTHAVMAMDFADLAERRRDWPAAVARWRVVAERFPDLADAPLGLARSLAQSGDAAGAADAQRAAMSRFPDSAETLASQAEEAAAAGDYPTALERWNRLCERHPDLPVGYQGRARALAESGEPRRAVESLAAAVARFPADVTLAVQWATTLSALRDWPRALELWLRLLEDFPGEPAVRSGIVENLGHAIADQGASGASFQIPAPLLEAYGADQAHAAERAALLRRFESLGDSCELGMVQRMYRVEQVSLLRWARTAPAHLIEALAQRLEGVGSPEHTRVYVEAGEYVTEDTRYHMHSHTFVSPAIEPLEAFAPEQRRRLQWLKNRFIDGLTRGARIYVYQAEEGIDDDTARALHAGLGAYNPRNRLVCIRLSDAEHAPGSVEVLAPGLFVGHVDRFSTIDIPVVAWLEVCETVARHVDSA